MWVKIRDLKNKILGRTGPIEEYNKTIRRIDELSAHEQNPEIKEKLDQLRDETTEAFTEVHENYGVFGDRFNPYTASRKETIKKTEAAQAALKKIIEEKARS